ncbi:MAG TPA: hypothetical protein VE377_16475 [Candidatus Dormibacteraeota bacterium]|nr:hypothetical protein [Candidatus Dormibacteraeota bacterium]
MRRCKTHLVRVCVLFLASVPAYGQRGTLGVDVGQTADTFAGLAKTTSAVVDINGEFAVIPFNPKTERPSVVAGGDIRVPSDTSNHAKEYALYGGVRFQFRNLTIGADGRVSKIYLPVANVDNQFFARDKMELFELPIVLRYKFGSSKRAFVEAKGAPEFSPRFRSSGAALVLPHPNFDHGYFVQGSVGYVFGNWYVKGTYENRYFKFIANPNNPSNLYNWRTTMITGGVGFAF